MDPFVPPAPLWRVLNPPTQGLSLVASSPSALRPRHSAVLCRAGGLQAQTPPCPSPLRAILGSDSRPPQHVVQILFPRGASAAAAGGGTVCAGTFCAQRSIRRVILRSRKSPGRGETARQSPGCCKGRPAPRLSWRGGEKGAFGEGFGSTSLHPPWLSCFGELSSASSTWKGP